MAQQVEAGLGPDGRPVAIKRVADPLAAGRLEREASLLRRLRHPGIVEVVEFVRHGDDATLTTHWVSGGSLQTAIDQVRNRTALLAVLADAAATVADLHERGVAHGRLDATHILLSGGGGAVLCGMAEASESNEPAFDVAALGALAADIAALASPRPTRPLLGGPVVDEVALQHAIDRATDPEGARRLPARAFADLLAGVLPPSPAAQKRVVARRHGPPVAPSRNRRDRARLLLAWAVAGLGLVVSLAVVIPALLTRSRGRAAAPAVTDGRTTTSTALATTIVAAASTSTTATAVRLWPTACPPTSATNMADIDGDGCADEITITGASVVAGGHRYSLSTDATDLVAVGDWDCDGVATPAVLRRTSGALDVFSTWPTPDHPSVTARRAGTYADASSITARPSGNGCATLVVSAVDGEHTVTA